MTIIAKSFVGLSSVGTSKEELKEKEEKASKIKRVQEEKLMRICKEMVFFIYLALPLGIVDME